MKAHGGASKSGTGAPKCLTVLAGYTVALHILFVWYCHHMLEVEEDLRRCKDNEKDCSGIAWTRNATRPCEPFTYYCRDTPITSSETKNKHTKITYESFACRNVSLMGNIGAYISKEPLAWKRVDDPLHAAMILDDGISFLISGSMKAGGCSKSEDVQTQIMGAFHHIPTILKKFSLIEVLNTRFVLLHRNMVNNGGIEKKAYDPHEQAHLMELMFDTWTFLPRTYEMSDLVQRQLLFKHVPCTGKNENWIVKMDTHGGRGIKQIETYEELRRLFLEPESDTCAHYQKVTNESSLDAKIASLTLAFRGGDRQRYRTHLDQGRNIVQNIVKPMLWEGKRFVSRAFFVALRTGRTRSRPETFPGHGLLDLWDLGAGRYDLFLFDVPYFMRHVGLVSDHSHSDIEALNATDLNAYVKSQGIWTPPKGDVSGKKKKAGFVESVFLPEVERIGRLCWESSEKTVEEYEERNIIEPDGTYQVFAGDFIISEDFHVKLLEFSTGLAFNRLRTGATATILPLLARQTAHLFLAEFGVRASPKARKGRVGEGSYPHFKKIAERAILPHP